MKAQIDFSLFTSPTEAFGRVHGETELPPDSRTGDVIEFIPDKVALNIESRTMQEGGVEVFGLADLVLHSLHDAAMLAGQLERECGLFVDVYD